jgi:DNA polymerase III alpha subunit
MNSMDSAYPHWVYCEEMKRTGITPQRPCLNRSERLWTQEGNECRCGLGGVDGLREETVAALLAERARAGPFKGLADVTTRVTTLTGWELARLVLAGACDFAGRSRATLLREAGLPQEPRLRQAADVPPWPVEAAPAQYPLCAQWQQEWALLGWLCGPPLGRVVRASVLADNLPDSRALPSLVGGVVRLVGLLAVCKEVDSEHGEMRFVSLVDEEGLFEAVVPTGCDAPESLGIGPWLVEGVVQAQHGVPVVRARRIVRATPEVVPAAHLSEEEPSDDPGDEADGEPAIIPLNGAARGRKVRR